MSRRSPRSRRSTARLPDDYRTFLLTNSLHHNFEFNFRCLSLTAVRRLRDLLGANGEHEFWKADWIPVSEDSCGNLKVLQCLSLEGEPDVYELLDVERQERQGVFYSPLPTFTQYLQHHLTLLRAGKYRLLDDGATLEVDRYHTP